MCAFLSLVNWVTQLRIIFPYKSTNRFHLQTSVAHDNISLSHERLSQYKDKNSLKYINGLTVHMPVPVYIRVPKLGLPDDVIQIQTHRLDLAKSHRTQMLTMYANGLGRSNVTDRVER